MKCHLFLLTLCLFSLPFVALTQKEVCKNIYVWDFTDENGQKNAHTQLLTQEVEDALTATSCRVLQRRNYAKLSEQIDNENAIQTIEGMSGTINEELQSIKAETVLFGRVQMDFSGNIMLNLSFQNLLTKEILKAESVMLAGEEAHNIAKRKAKISSFVAHCVGPKVIGSAETTFWQSVQQLGTPEGYQDYLNKYPQGKYTTQATAALADDQVYREIQGEKKTKRKIRKLMDYVENTQHIHYMVAREQLETLLWQEEMYEEYKSYFPEGKYAAQVDDKYEAMIVRQAPKSPGYWVPRYVGNFPNGKYLDRMEDLLWGNVLESKAAQSLAAKDYLALFPAGKYAKQAREIIGKND